MAWNIAGYVYVPTWKNPPSFSLKNTHVHDNSHLVWQFARIFRRSLSTWNALLSDVFFFFVRINSALYKSTHASLCANFTVVNGMHFSLCFDNSLAYMYALVRLLALLYYFYAWYILTFTQSHIFFFIPSYTSCLCLWHRICPYVETINYTLAQTQNKCY